MVGCLRWRTCGLDWSRRIDSQMEKKFITMWTVFCSIYLILYPAGVTAIIRRQFFPENASLLDEMGTPKLENYASKEYCTEPCTTMVLEASQNCETCLLAHPTIPRYVEMIHWQLVSDVLIALAYFSIPVELLFFIYKAQVNDPRVVPFAHWQRWITKYDLCRWMV